MAGWEQHYSTEASAVKDNESYPTASPTGDTGLECYMVLFNAEKLVIGFICFLAGPVTVLENALVLAAIVATASLRKRPSYLFIGSLALADVFAGCFFTVNFLDFHLFDRRDNPTAYLFKLGGVTLAFTGSVGSLLLTSLDRYLCIHQASRYKVLLTRRRALRGMLALWSAILLISFLPLLGWRCPTDLEGWRCPTDQEGWRCPTDLEGWRCPTDLNPPCSRLFPYIDHRYLACWTSFVLVLLFLILSAYALILWKAHKHEASMTGLQGAAPGQARMRMDIRLARTLGLILLILVGCWLPALSFMLADVSFYLSRSQQRAFAFCSTLCLVNSAVNPLLYALRCRELRVALVQLLRRLVGIVCCRGPTGDTASAEGNSCSTSNKVGEPELTDCQVLSVSERVSKQQLDISG